MLRQNYNTLLMFNVRLLERAALRPKAARQTSEHRGKRSINQGIGIGLSTASVLPDPPFLSTLS
jgi:hypothetical protein